MKKTLHVSGFPKLIAAEEVKKFLEGHTCSGAVVAIEVKPEKRGSRAYAKVQFTRREHAEKIIHLANIDGLYYYLGTSLKAFEQDTDFVNLRQFNHEMDGLTLNFGCQVSNHRFSVLWRALDVSVKFGAGLNKIHFFLCHDLVQYKLQLSYEDIWQIVLYNPSGQTTKLLLIQLYRAPRIYKKHDSTYCFFKDIPDDHWVASRCGIRGGIPSAFKIRYGGYKGVVAVDPNSSVKLSLRDSMLKYQSDDTKLEVLSWSKYHPCFLNRQIITLLSTLGVSDRVFQAKQREAVAQLDNALDLMAPGENTNILKEMLKCGYKPDEEPFLSMMLQTSRLAKLLDLQMKARIFIPQARQMMGCMDETGTLEYGQVFVQLSGSGDTITGKVAVAKNPCLHPGDVRVLRAVDVPELRHMVDCVVFPRKGKRPHPNECCGSDLGGDIYFVCWDPELIPPHQEPPMTYNPAPKTQLDHDVTIEEVEEYFTNYMVNDSFGIIASAHTVFADKEDGMALSSPCLELAKLYSVAIEFPHTGIPAEIPPHLRVKEFPDFMDMPHKTAYQSEVKDISPHVRTFTREVAVRSYDRDMEVQGFREYIYEAFEYKSEYDYRLGNLMDDYGIKTEAEILSGAIRKTSKIFDRRKDADSIAAAVRALREEGRSWFNKGSQCGDAYAMASAWYHVTYHPYFWGSYNVRMKRRDHYISFPWCVYGMLVQIKRDRQFRRGLSRKRSSATDLHQAKRYRGNRIR